ncbi:MAG: hypothetical protein ABI776_03995 [Nocardioidaceae bacterium]
MPDDVLARAGLARGERVLAWAAADDGTCLLGTRDALLLVEPAETIRLLWERVETADWDRGEDRIRVLEVGEFGRVRPVHSYVVPEPGLLLQMVRERVTASVVLQRRVAVGGGRGLLVIARRPPRRQGEISWAYQLDPGLDPDDPAVQRAAEAGLRAAQEELGSGPASS